MTPFGDRLGAALDARGSLCVGIDPHAALLSSWGLPDSIEGLAAFAAVCVEALGGTVAVVKPQSAFFERFGSLGVAVLERTIVDLRSAGALVLLDVKRGDIGSTMAAYADAYLDPASPIASDAITVSPFLGVGSLQPAFDVAAANGGGVFTLALTSNPEAGEVQFATRPDGTMLGQYVLDAIGALNAAGPSAGPLGSFGVVVGATIRTDLPVSFGVVGGPILAPGVGAQGGSADSVRRIFGDALAGVLPSVSREVLAAGPDAAALRASAERLIDEFAYLRR
ncbi:MAG: pyrF [Jatrophihabitantaceae bacterium]|nr:pyrF [Jatrophihabitantaceae bacterium]